MTVFEFIEVGVYLKNKNDPGTKLKYLSWVQQRFVFVFGLTMD